jgi:hypothetical protein
MVPNARWQQKYGACVLLADMMRAAPPQSAAFLPAFVPPLRELMVDARDEVKEAALSAMQFALSLVGNRDIEHLLQARLCACRCAHWHSRCRAPAAGESCRACDVLQARRWRLCAARAHALSNVLERRVALNAPRPRMSASAI